MIDLVCKSYTGSKAPERSFFKKVLDTAAKELKLKGNFGISINLVGEGKIKELNRKYRNKNKPTDVLSFPINSTLHASRFTLHDLGDIFVCLSIAKKEAKRENISIEAKLAQLIVHGLLHLLGYDHPDDSVGTPTLRRRGEKMFKLERRILSKWQDHI